MDQQSKLMELQLLQQDFTQLQNNVQTIEQQLAEVELIKKSLDDFSKQKKDSESLMALANGIFAEAKILNVKHLLVNVGSNVVVKKTVPETIQLIDEQSKELEKYKKQAMDGLNEILVKIQEIQASFKEKKE